MGLDRRLTSWWRHWALLLAALVCPDPGSSSAAAPDFAESQSESQADPQAAPAEALPRQQVLRRALRSDTSQQYLLYLPAHIAAGEPVFVTVHGISRNVDEHATMFAPFAEARGVVLIAPSFTEADNEDYQRVGRGESGKRSDQALNDILDEVHALTGVDTHRYTLFGFSGGAQFAHRYLMAHPRRIERAALGAPGWYLFPDPRKPYPYGLGPSADSPGVHFDPEHFLRVPVTVFVGADDVGDVNLRVNPEVNRQQGLTRVQRAKRWTAAMRHAAELQGLKPRVRCEVVPGIGHSFADFMQKGQLGERVFGFLYGDAPRAPGDTSVSLR